MPLISTVSWDLQSYTKIMGIASRHRSKYIRDRINQETLPSVNTVIGALDSGEFTLGELEIYATRLLKISQRGT
jgi:hypothetical protein